MHWLITVPETAQRTNMVLNPSAETTGNFVAHNGSTVTRSLSYARFGIQSYAVTTGAIQQGINLALSTLSNAVHHVTFYAYKSTAFAGALQVSLNNGTNYNTATLIESPFAASQWNRYQVSIVAAQANGGTAVIIRCANDESSWVVDGVLVQALDGYYTTYFDGDQSGGRWTGLRHGSTSTHDPQERSIGRERDTEDYGIRVLQQPGAGMPPVTNNLQPLALQPGALFQSTTVQPRYIDLAMSYSGASSEAFHSVRKDLIDLFKPDVTQGQQPITLAHTHASGTKHAHIKVRYDGGAELGTVSKDIEQPVIRVVADDPYFFEDNQEVAVLDFQDSVSNANNVLRRRNGQWGALGTGCNNFVYSIQVDKQRGRVYFGGGFTTGNGVTLNKIGYWDGTTFVAMDSGVGNAEVWDIAIAPNGDVWICGTFTTVGSGAAACKGLARWNVSTGTWTAFNPSTASFGAVYAVTIAPDTGTVYIGGEFADWDGIANADNLAKYDSGTWTAMGTGASPPSGQVLDMYAVSSTKVYVGGGFTTANGVTVNRICYWNGTTFVAMGSGCNDAVWAIAVARNQDVYIGGAFNSTPVAGRIAVWRGSSWSALGSGFDSTVYELALDASDRLYAVGAFTTAGGIALADRIAYWNGTKWAHVDLDIASLPFFYAVQVDGDDLYVGFDGDTTATASGLTTVTNNGTASAYPTITIVGPSSGSMTTQWIENYSTRQRWYFDLLVQSGETVTLDTFNRQVTSDWRGRITNNPLSGSDNLYLLPGANTIVCFNTGFTTDATIQMRWIPRHWSVDGVAA